MISLFSCSRTLLRGEGRCNHSSYYVLAQRYMKKVKGTSVNSRFQQLLQFFVTSPSSTGSYQTRSSSSFITANVTSFHKYTHALSSRIHSSSSRSNSNSVTSNDSGQTSKKKERRKREFVTPYTTKEDMKKKTADSSTAYAYSTPPIPMTTGLQHQDSFDDYLKKSSLSPWVPTPDSVARRMLQLAHASADDIHCDLGCGDGRVNGIALQHFHVARTVGIDNDPDLLKMARDRLLTIGYSCRFFNYHHLYHDENTTTNPRDELLFMENNEEHSSSIDSAKFPAKVDFIYADLKMYLNDNDNNNNSNQRNDGQENHKELQIIKDRYDIFSDCTVLTMFFVEDALEKIRPTLEERFKGSGCRIITNGYAIPGWKPDWIEPILDLKIHLYDMSKGCTF